MRGDESRRAVGARSEGWRGQKGERVGFIDHPEAGLMDPRAKTDRVVGGAGETIGAWSGSAASTSRRASRNNVEQKSVSRTKFASAADGDASRA